MLFGEYVKLDQVYIIEENIMRKGKMLHIHTRIYQGVFVLLVLLRCFGLVVQLGAQGRNRDDIEAQYKWNLTDIYPSMKDWQKAKATFP